MKYNIALITLCYNESKMIPFVIEYWKKFVTHAYVFDNGSTDNSKELLSQYDWISIIDYSHLTGNKLNDLINRNIKNNFWKTIKTNYDYCVICDFDECLYCENWEQILNKFKFHNVACVMPFYYDIIVKNYPAPIEDNRLYHEVYTECVGYDINEYNQFHNKILLIDCSKIYETNFGVGSHTSNPLGIINNEITVLQKFRIHIIKCFHLAEMGLDFIIEKYNHNKECRMSDDNLKYRLGSHYLEDNEKIIEEYNKKLNKRKPIAEQEKYLMEHLYNF